MIRELDLELNAVNALDISANIPALLKGEKGEKGDKGEAGTITPEVIEEIASKVDLKDYAKKSEIPDISGKADVNHTHSQYLTQHQSLAGYAKTSDIPAPYDDTEVRGLIAGKADSAHEHDYVTKDYYGNNKAGLIKAATGLNISSTTGGTYATVYSLAKYKSTTETVDTTFISKGTLNNVLTEYSKTSDIETMIDNKLTPLEALADGILEVM